MPRRTLALALALGAFTAACAHDTPKTDDTRIHGTVAQELRQPGMEALAIGADGRWISTPVAADGGFALDLPSGQSYRVVLATRTPSGAERVVARVVLDGTSGRTVWVSTTARDIAFGTLHQVGTATTASNPSAVSTQSETVESGEGAKHDDDGAESTEHDKDSYDGCAAPDAKDVEPSNDDADGHADSAEHEDAHEGSCDDSEKEDD